MNRHMDGIFCHSEYPTPSINDLADACSAPVGADRKRCPMVPHDGWCRLDMRAPTPNIGAYARLSRERVLRLRQRIGDIGSTIAHRATVSVVPGNGQMVLVKEE